MTVLIILLFLIVILCGRYSMKLGNVLNSQDIGKVRRYMAYFILIFITSFRYDVGWDYLTYYRRFAIPGGASYFEPIPRLLYYISQYFDAPWLLFTLFFSLSMIFVLLGIKDRSVDEYESLIIFMALFYFESMSTIRQFLAISVLFYAFKYVKNKKLIFYLVWIVIASLIHTSAWFAIPIYFIYNYLSLKVVVLFTTIVIVFLDRIAEIIFRISLFHKYYTFYINLLNDGGAFIRYVYLLLACAGIFIYIQKKQMFDEDVSKTLSVFVVGVAFPFIIGSHTGLRITFYYVIEIIILLPKMLEQMELRKGRIAMMFPFYAYYILFLIVDFMNGKAFSPFTFYWKRQ